MNLFIYLMYREINESHFPKKPVIILKRQWNREFQWYCERLS